MSVFANDELPIHRVSRISTRILASKDTGAQDTTIWQQWLGPGNFIPPHYHDAEEVLVLLQGQLELELGGTVQTVSAPATIIVPAHQVHSMQQAGDSTVELLAVFPHGEPKIFAVDGSLRPMPWEDRGEEPN